MLLNLTLESSIELVQLQLAELACKLELVELSRVYTEPNPKFG
jgi:hypothetical protein